MHLTHRDRTFFGTFKSFAFFGLFKTFLASEPAACEGKSMRYGSPNPFTALTGYIPGHVSPLNTHLKLSV